MQHHRPQLAVDPQPIEQVGGLRDDADPEGDFEATDRAYYDSPERAALPVDPASFVAEKWLTMVEDVTP